MTAVITTSGSDGYRVFNYSTSSPLEQKYHYCSSDIKTSVVSKDGRLAAVADEDHAILLNLQSFDIQKISVQHVFRICISPDGSVIFIFTSCKALQAEHNIKIFDTKSGNLIKEYTNRVFDNWQPQWSSDSSMCAFYANGSIHIYTGNQFGGKPTTMVTVRGLSYFAMSSSVASPHIAAYIPGQKGQPSVVRIFRLADGQCTAIANKSFYRSDYVQMLWNAAGTDLLVLTSTNMSDESYYGDQHLFYVTASQSGNSAVVTMPRKGPIDQVAWRPTLIDKTSGEELFVVCHGFMPTSVTVFDTNCEPRFNFGTGAWNFIQFNPQGNLLLIGGQGNIPGHISVWNFDRQKCLSSFKIPDITSVSWLNDGEHLLMSTTTPRLRVNNGFGVWHYGGEKLFFHPVAPRANPRPATIDMPAAVDHELYQASVVSTPKLPQAPVPKMFNGLTVTKPVAVYVPPALRNRSAVTKQAMAASQMNDSAKLQGPLSTNTECFATKSGCKKKRKKPTSTKEQLAATDDTTVNDSSDKNNQGLSSAPVTDGPLPSLSKQISGIRKKLNQIESLKQQQANGVQLIYSQVEKIATEENLRTKLAALTLSKLEQK